MGKSKAYKEQEPKQPKVSEAMTTYRNSDIVIGNRDDIKFAITSEELLDRLRPRLKALFK